MNKEGLYVGIRNGVTVITGTYQECLEEVGEYTDYGWVFEVGNAVKPAEYWD